MTEKKDNDHNLNDHKHNQYNELAETMSEELCAYDINSVGPGKGSCNMGNTCWLNSIMGSILSLPSVRKSLMQYKNSPNKVSKTIALILLNLYDQIDDGKIPTVNMRNFHRLMLDFARKRRDNVSIRRNAQEDAHEGFMIIMDMLEFLPYVRVLFVHRTLATLYCGKCEKNVSKKTEENTTFQTGPMMNLPKHEMFKNVDDEYDKVMSLNDFIWKQNTYIDEGFTCPGCKNKDKKFKRKVLIMSPEILPIVFKKYNKKIKTEFPMTLKFPEKKGKYFIYKLVAQVEHYGGRSGGHYIAICKRSDGWKRLDDRSVSDAKPGPTEHTYMIFYHYMGVSSDGVNVD